MEEEQIEKTINGSLEEFSAPQAQAPQAQAPQAQAPQAQAPQAQAPQAQAPQAQAPQAQAPQAQAPPMVTPPPAPLHQEKISEDDISVGREYVETGQFFLDEGDYEFVDWNGRKAKVSKNLYTIENVDIQEKEARQKRAIGEFEYTKDDKPVIVTRMIITYVGSKYKSNLPKIRWWDNKRATDGIQINPSVQRIKSEKELQSKYKTVVSKLHYLFCKTYGLDDIEIGEIGKAMKGKQVRLRESEEEWNNNTKTRLDIHEFH